jgi:hypothetical protein
VEGARATIKPTKEHSQMSYTAQTAGSPATENALLELIVEAAWSMKRAQRLQSELPDSAVEALRDPEFAALVERLGEQYHRVELAYIGALQELSAVRAARKVASRNAEIKRQQMLTALTAAGETARKFQRGHSAG